MNELIIYQSPDNVTEIEVTFENDSVWLTQKQIAELFQRDRTVIAKHISNIFTEQELVSSVVCAKFAHTTEHGAIRGKNQTNLVNY